MAKKKSSNGIGWGKIAGFMAFIALIIAGVSALVGLFGGSLGIIGAIGHVMLVVSVFLSAWFFVKSTPLPGKKLYWQIAIAVVAALAAFGAVNFF